MIILNALIMAKHFSLVSLSCSFAAAKSNKIIPAEKDILLKSYRPDLCKPNSIGSKKKHSGAFKRCAIGVV